MANSDSNYYLYEYIQKRLRYKIKTLRKMRKKVRQIHIRSIIYKLDILKSAKYLQIRNPKFIFNNKKYKS